MIQQLTLDLTPPPPPTLANFIAGHNAETLDALERLEVGRAVYVWGPPGSGRTHLLRGLAGAWHGRYVPPDQAETVLHRLALTDGPMQALIAVDDVQALGPDGQAGLFALYNRWREHAGSASAFALALTGDRAPLAMPLREDLRTRLGWDLVFRLEPLSDDDRALALANQARERGLRISPDIIRWLLRHHERDLRRLNALIHALDRYSLERQRPITLPLLKELLQARLWSEKQ